VKKAFLALGSNLGDRWENLSRAMVALAQERALALKKVSSVFETEPVGYLEQPDFFNLVLEIETALSPEKLLVRCLEIETELGRVRHERWGPRNIDIDVLWYDDQRVAQANLTLPHPRMLERAFVMVPLAEIAPELVLEGETVASRAAAIAPAARIRRIGRRFSLVPPHA